MSGPLTLAEVNAGDTLVADGGFTCVAAGPVIVASDADGRLHFPCADGQHYLDGQADDGVTIIGLARP